MARAPGNLKGQALISLLMEKEGVPRVYTYPFAQEGARQGNRILFRAVLETFPLVQGIWKGEIKEGKLHLTLFLNSMNLLTWP